MSRITCGSVLVVLSVCSSAHAYTCFGIPDSDPNVCSGHGTCIADETCSCDAGWSGAQCETPVICYELPSNDPNVCSGHGACIAADTCDCQVGFIGDECASMLIPTVTVGNPGNAKDTHGDGYGGVDYFYNIGTFEVTAGQYTEFLNAVADDDTHGLYTTEMWSSGYGCKIERTGSSPDYSYSVGAEWADRPVNYMSWGDAARFANWLHNGQPTGAQDLSTTEDGSYYLNGAMSNNWLGAIVREPDATWVIPSEDEWYKAAYHYNDGATSNYYDYPTRNDSIPSMDLVDPDPGNNANFYDGDFYSIGSPYYRTVGGDFENSESPYGTFDQGGNVCEWNEAASPGSYDGRGWRGASFQDYPSSLHASIRTYQVPSYELYITGFRVADVSADCGNGIVEFGEVCDDGNDNDTDACLSTCQHNPEAIPAVSTWGLAIMLLALLAVGSIVIVRRPRAVA